MEELVREMDVRSIIPNLRYICATEAIEELCESMGREGQQEPIRIWFTGESFRVLDGEKRLRACRKLGMQRVKVIIVDSQTHVEQEHCLG